MASKVLFTREISPEAVLALYKELGKELPGRIAIKLHSGEAGNQNYLNHEFWRPLIDSVGGTVVECNTAYEGQRDTTEKHRALLHDHGWDKYFPVDLMDAEGPDLVLDIPGGKRIRKNLVGKNMANYDSLLVLSHFKGHPMGGYGGALKQLSIGCASSAGKAWIHSAGVTDDPAQLWTNLPEQDVFLEAMAESAGSVTEFFHGNAVYINVMMNLSVDCDCCAEAEDPCMADVGILASLDPVAIDQACIDLVYAATDDPGQAHFIERVETMHGVHTIEAAAELGIGSRDYELVTL